VGQVDGVCLAQLVQSLPPCSTSSSESGTPQTPVSRLQQELTGIPPECRVHPEGGAGSRWSQMTTRLIVRTDRLLCRVRAKGRTRASVSRCATVKRVRLKRDRGVPLHRDAADSTYLHPPLLAISAPAKWRGLRNRRIP
jgi:hypothetical protein